MGVWATSAAAALVMAASAGASSGDVEIACDQPLDGLRANDIQSVGTHNSYKIAIPPAELAMIAATNPDGAESLDYAHRPLTWQLDEGARHLEIDVFHDPDGGLYRDPLLPRLTAGQEGAAPYDPAGMDAPGFKVLHIQDLDVRSHCATFIACLETIDAWSLAHPDHAPILLLINPKQGGLNLAGTVTAPAFDADVFDALDGEIRSVFGPERLIEPDDVRAGAGTLRDGVLAGGWPALDDARGKVIFGLAAPRDTSDAYLRGRASLEGLPIFTRTFDESADHAAYFTLNNPVRDMARIQELVAQGYLVRTRADSGTTEARTNDTARRDAAFASGAHYVSTDYIEPRAEWSEYVVTTPGGAPARCNPVRAGEAAR